MKKTFLAAWVAIGLGGCVSSSNGLVKPDAIPTENTAWTAWKNVCVSYLGAHLADLDWINEKATATTNGRELEPVSHKQGQFGGFKSDDRKWQYESETERYSITVPRQDPTKCAVISHESKYDLFSFVDLDPLLESRFRCQGKRTTQILSSAKYPRLALVINRSARNTVLGTIHLNDEELTLSEAKRMCRQFAG